MDEMTRREGIKLVAAGAAGAAAAALLSGAAAPATAHAQESSGSGSKPAPAVLEYKVLTVPTVGTLEDAANKVQTELNSVGKDGWSLVQLVYSPFGPAYIGVLSRHKK
jgi:hypothetical protein